MSKRSSGSEWVHHSVPISKQFTRLPDAGDGNFHRIELLSSRHQIHGCAAGLHTLSLRSNRPDAVTATPDWLESRALIRHWDQRVLLLYAGDTLEAAVLLAERTWCGISTGYFRAGDAAGDTLILCEAGQEDRLLQAALRLLLRMPRTFLVFFDRLGTTAELRALLPPPRRGLTMSSREVPVYWQCPLGDTLDATLATMGYRTRRNVRYSLRRAGKSGWRFVPEMTHEQVRDAVCCLAARSTHPYTVEIAERRLRIAHTTPGAFAIGIVDSTGRWLSCLIGQRIGEVADVFWQSNAAGIRGHSLCITMRSMFLREEIRRGSRLIRYIGGTCELMQHFCVPNVTTQTLLVRRGVRLWLARRTGTANLAALQPAPASTSPDRPTTGQGDLIGLNRAVDSANRL